MLTHFFRRRPVLARLRAGPLGLHIDGFATELLEQGYARASAKAQIYLVAAMSRWLERRHFEVTDLTEERAERFLRQHRKGGDVQLGARAALRRLLKRLRVLGVVAAPVPDRPAGRFEAIERSYERYLSHERGLSRATFLNYLPAIRRLLSDCFAKGPIDLHDLVASDVSRFVVQQARSKGLGRAKLMVTALRSFFRFLRLRGEIRDDLASCVPSIPDWRLSVLPKYLDPGDVERLVRSCDRSSPVGRRDRAILLLLARLGLRAGEVVAMKLEDFDWEKGTLLVRGKGCRQERLPIPTDVGKAIVEYLRRGRPCCSVREVFVRARAPLRGFANSVAICTIVMRGLSRAGLDPPHKGAHLLRHSLATGMLRKGASMVEIGEILRHRDPATTEIYAKVDVRKLSALAQPWPGGAR